MPLSDLARALPGALLYGVLPGFLLATCVVPRWRWWERLAASPGLAAGLAGLWGALLHDIGAGFRPASYLPLVAVLAAAAWLRRGRAARRSTARPPAVPAVVAVAALVAGLASAAVVTWSFRDEAVPVQTDAPVHGQMVAAMVRTHDVLPPITQAVDQSAWLRPRMGFEAVAALTAQTGGSPVGSMLPVTLVAVVLLPLGLAALALEATGDWRLAAVAPLLGVGMAFPANQLTFGEFHLVVDSTLVVPAILAAGRALRGTDTRDQLAMLAAVTAGIWVIHGLEAITAAVVGVPFLVAATLRDRVPGWPARLLQMGGAVVAGAVLADAAVRPPALPAAVPPAGAGRVVGEASNFVGVAGALGPADTLRTFLDLALPTTALAVLLLVGVVVAFRTRRLRWAVVTSVVLMLCFADVLTTARLGALWTRLFPWAVTDRLAGLQYWLMPMLMAMGLLWLAAQLTAVLAHRRSGGRRAAPVAAALVAAVVVAALAMGVRRDHDVYVGGVRQAAFVGSADLHIMADLDAMHPGGATVLTDGMTDAGQWLGALTAQRMYYSKPYLQGHPADARLAALAAACTTPPDPALFGGVDVVFVGSRSPAGFAPRWDVSCLARVPWLREVARETDADGTAAAFAVTRAG